MTGLRPLAVIVLIVSIFALHESIQAQSSLNISFTTIDVPGAGLTNVSGINNNGDMVGWYSATANSAASGFLLSSGTFTFFNYPTGSSTLAYGIDDSGLIVGTAFLYQNTAAVGFTYDGTTFTKIRVSNNLYTYAEGIDNAGDIVGGYGNFGGNDGYEKAGAKFKKITPPGNYTLVYATAINNFGQVVGTADQGSFFYNAAKFKTLAFPGATQTYVNGINDSAILVGTYVGCSSICGAHGFMLQKGVYTSFDYPGAIGTFAYGINNAGEVVGSYTLDQQTFHGFVTDPIPLGNHTPN